MRRRGFTLIEMMISVAILAIMLAAPFAAYNTFGALHRERLYRDALHSARQQLDWLRKVPADRLPPQQVVAPADGHIELKQPFLVRGSVRLFHPNGTSAGDPVAVDIEHGVVTVSKALAGQKLVIDYAFALPDMAEAHVVPSGPQPGIQLLHPDIRQYVSVRIVSGNTVEDIGGRAARTPGGYMQLPARSAGHVVLVDYYETDHPNTVKALQVGDDLRPLVPPVQGGSHPRLLVVEEGAAEPRMRLRLSEVRMP